MTQPINSPAHVEGNDADTSQPNRAPELATKTPTHHDQEQQIAWLRAGPEVFHAPGPRLPSRQIIGLSALAIVVSALTMGAMAHLLASGPFTGENTPPPTAARPQARSVTSRVPATNASPTVATTPVTPNLTPATAPDAPASPTSPVLAATPKTEQHLPLAGDTTARRFNSRHEPQASPPSSGGLPLPEATAASWPNSEDGDQQDAAQPAQPAPPSQDRQDHPSRGRWTKTTTCDASGRCVDHYNPARWDQ
jgi:hypothetical protein